MPAKRIEIKTIHCDIGISGEGYRVACGVYTGSNPNHPESWIWRSGVQSLAQHAHWEVNALSDEFEGPAWLGLFEVAEASEPNGLVSESIVKFHGWQVIDNPPEISTSDDPWFQCHFHPPAHFTVVYSVEAFEPGVCDSELAPAESEITMLGTNSRLPLDRRLTAMDALLAQNDTRGFESQALALGVLCRTAVQRYEKTRLERALLNSAESNSFKTAQAGTLARDLARMEFLLGWLYKQGYSVRKRWENGNVGVLAEIYQRETGLTSLPSSDRLWCTSFAGAVHRWIGFRVLNLTERALRRATDTRIFWSNARFIRWARDGGDVTASASQAGIGDPINTASGGICVTVDRRSAWSASEGAVPAPDVQWDSLLPDGVSPAPGDIMSINGFHHTVMIDEVEEVATNSFIVYTVEGNANDAVRSRLIDFRTSDFTSVVESEQTSERPPPVYRYRRRSACAIIRPSWRNYVNEDSIDMVYVVASCTPNVIQLVPNSQPGEVLETIVSRLKAYMAQKNWISHSESNRVYDWCGQPQGATSET